MSRVPGFELKFVSCHKYLGAYVTSDLKDVSNIKHECRSKIAELK